MGTNYYVVKDKCDCCGRYDKEYHIGKSSHGWSFSFQGYPHMKLTSWKAWKEFLKNQEIIDEYGNNVEYLDLVDLVEGAKSPGYQREDGQVNLSHNLEGIKKGWYNSEYDWDDEDGYSFTIRDYS